MMFMDFSDIVTVTRQIIITPAPTKIISEYELIVMTDKEVATDALAVEIKSAENYWCFDIYLIVWFEIIVMDGISSYYFAKLKFSEI